MNISLYLPYFGKLIVNENIAAVVRSMTDVRDFLKQCAQLCNQTGLGSEITTQENQKDNALFVEMMQGIHMASPLDSHQELIRLTRSESYIRPWWKVESAVADSLTRISNLWSDLVEYSKKFDPTSDDKAVWMIVDDIGQWIDGNDKGHLPHRDGRKPKFPSLVAGERGAIQPIVGALLQSLSRVPIQGAQPTDRRFIDLASKELDPYNPILVFQETSFPKEVNNLRRKNQNAERMHIELLEQAVGRCAMRALVGFDVGDVGVGSTSVCMILTPIYMQVVRLRLVGLGTKEADVKLDATELFPLVRKTAFVAAVEEDDDREYLSPLLYPDHVEDTIVSTNPVVQGIQRLWELLHSSEDDLGMRFFGGMDQQASFHLSGSNDDEEDRSLFIDSLLGSGSQGVVYSVRDRDDAFVKASVAGEVGYIKREIKALRALGRAASHETSDHSIVGESCSALPKLECKGRVKYEIRRAVVEVPAVLLTPKGIPAMDLFMCSDFTQSNKLVHLCSLLKGGMEALTFAHRRGVYHLDVSPRNFVFVGGEDDRFVIVDWACAACDGESVIGFRGSLPFAHASVHAKCNTQRWTPQEDHDNIPLLFTVCALSKENPVPWPAFTSRLSQKDNEEAFGSRRHDTEQALVTLISFACESGEFPLFEHRFKQDERKPKIMTTVRGYLKDA